MYRTYRPSGKVSWIFFPFALLSTVLLIPVGSGLCLLLLKVSPGTMWDVLLFAICGGILLNFTCRCCIDISKVRNPAAAWILGIWNGLLFWYLLFVFSLVFFPSGQESNVFSLTGSGLQEMTERCWQVVQSPGVVWKEVSHVMQTGVPIQGNTGNVLITLRGVPCSVVSGLLCFFTVFLTGLCYYVQSTQPFCERTRTWYGEVEVYVTYIRDTEAFRQRLLLGDHRVFQELEGLREVNSDHALATLFYEERGTEFYVTIENKKRKDPDDKNKTPSYDEDEVVKFVALDQEMGRQLLTMGQSGTGQPVAEVETRKTKLRRIIRLGGRYLLLAAQAAVLFAAVTKTGVGPELLSNGMFLFYTVAAVFVSGINFCGSFGKRNVIKLEEDQEFWGMLKPYQVEQEEKPLADRIFYLLMFLVSLSLACLSIKEVL